MGRARPTVLGWIEGLATGDAALAQTLRQAEFAARLVAREVRIALSEGAAPETLRDFAERAFVEMLAVPDTTGEILDASGREVGRGFGSRFRVTVDALRAEPGEAPVSSVRVPREAGGAVSVVLVHAAAPFLVVVAQGADGDPVARVFEEDPDGGPFVAPRPGLEGERAPLIRRLGGAIIRAA